MAADCATTRPRSSNSAHAKSCRVRMFTEWAARASWIDISSTTPVSVERKTSSRAPRKSLIYFDIVLFSLQAAQTSLRTIRPAMADQARDHVDWISELWLSERPDIPVAPLATWGRLKRASALFDRVVSAQVKPYRLRLGEFEVLAALRRSGAPFKMNPTDLSEALIVTAGTMTNRIARLERAGLVVRLRQPDDGRGILVTLTERGREVFDAAFASVVVALDEIVKPISDSQEQLAQILRSLLVPFGEHAEFMSLRREIGVSPSI